MEYRVTKKSLQKKVDLLNKKIKYESSMVELDHAACYGGYTLINYNGSHHLTPRMAPREMNQYLEGALDWITAE